MTNTQPEGQITPTTTATELANMTSDNRQRYTHGNHGRYARVGNGIEIEGTFQTYVEIVFNEAPSLSLSAEARAALQSWKVSVVDLLALQIKHDLAEKPNVELHEYVETPRTEDTPILDILEV